MFDQDWFTLWVEEEYLLIDYHSKALVANPPESICPEVRRLGTRTTEKRRYRTQTEPCP